MSKSAERIQARILRKKGESVKEIAKKLDVSSGSVSIWTQDLVLTEVQQKFLRERQIAAGHKGRMMGAETNREKKRVRISVAKEQAVIDIEKLSKESLFYIGLGLYWGEGVKTTSGSLAISNSDPRVIQLMVRWFSECFDVEKTSFMPRVFISDIHRDREEVITKFWVKTLGIPRAQFKNMIFLNKGKKVYENRDVYYGVLALRVAKGGDIRYRILAQIDRVAQLAKPSRRSSRVRTRHS